MICLDTNAVIVLINATSTRLRERLDVERMRGEAIVIPTVVLFELCYGAAKSARPKENYDVIKGFMGGPVSLLDFGPEDAAEAGQLRTELERKGTPVGPYDVLIAAQARRRDALLVTANQREFNRVPRLQTENWAS
jgi:tRNA(fMet)-specific endonuclease VapC